GHVMRCLALADYLKKNYHADVTFVCKTAMGNLCDWLEDKSYNVVRLDQELNWEQDAYGTIKAINQLFMKVDWIIVDHYGLDYQWEQRLREKTRNIIVIDDLANRNHDCDVLIDQNLDLDMQTRYIGKIPPNCQLLLGPQYAFLREEFYSERKKLTRRSGTVNRVLVFLGGSDPYNTTFKVITALSKLDLGNRKIDVVIGASNPYKDQIEEFCKRDSHFCTHFQVSNMAEMMAKSDLAIGAGGITTWERCFLGLPSFTILLAENQRRSTEAVESTGATRCLGWEATLNDQVVVEQISKAFEQKQMLLEMSHQALILMGDSECQGIAAIFDKIKDKL
ncbi:UDP-2,4-diacetamido-2,4,6-trideoxy-beta-L-altropyranose hydrolase, partial [Paenibacillus sp. TAF58]